VGFAGGIKPDNNHFYVPTQPEYRDNSGGPSGGSSSPVGYDRADLAGAEALLTSNGYTLSNNVLSRRGRPVTLRITSSQANKVRNAEEVYVINQLKQLGIVVTERDTLALDATLKSHDFDLVIFGWSASPFPSGTDPIFQTRTKSSGGLNYDSYSNKTVDDLISRGEAELDHSKQGDLYNQVDAILWRDMVSLPLFESPTLLVYQSKYRNLGNNVTNEGPMYNMQMWGRSK
jgi:peptide/nickel transport system substrate-binding protein